MSKNVFITNMEDFKLEVNNVVRKLTLTVLTGPLSRHVHSAILKSPPLVT